ncbi:MAG: DUF58 domain-containing protein [Endomicrobia bacterium]|nr:DUF58 domain-containing protein [Endomicrobiia bacterium]MCL2506271.1 DUF58 domain-containing protein [Endomicrobiia bacterium]
MLDKEILKKQIRKLEIRSNKLVNDVFAGQYKSVFKGQGIEFAEVREYQIGDDFRSIDRNVTARHGKPYIKLFAEERELSVIFLIDASASQNFTSTDKMKSEIAAEVAAVLAFSSLKNNDRVGMISFTDKIEKIVTPKKGKNNILRIINDILDSRPSGTKTSISKALKTLNEIWRKKAVVFLISDFQDENYEKDLAITAKRHDIICIKINDKTEVELPDVGLVEIMDPETQSMFIADASFSGKDFKEKSEAFEIKTDKLFKRLKIDAINLNTSESYIKPLIKFFRNREARKAMRV